MANAISLNDDWRFRPRFKQLTSFLKNSEFGILPTVDSEQPVDIGRSGFGLCADCIHARRIMSDRGSVFLLCKLSSLDNNFVKYPRLPVRSCGGYERAETANRVGPDSRISR